MRRISIIAASCAVLMMLSRVCVAASFTSVTNGMSWASTSIVNEITLAIRERLIAGAFIAKATASDRVPGDDATRIWDRLSSGSPVNTYNWRAWQEAVVQMASAEDAYLDHTVSPTNVTAMVPMTLARWKTASGLTNGFRRAITYDPSADDWTDYGAAFYTNGYAMVGDIMGPWIIEDLHDGLSALKTTWSETYGQEESRQSTNVQQWCALSVLGPSTSDCAAARSGFLDTWAATNWVTSNPVGVNGHKIYRVYGTRDSGRFTAHRSRGMAYYVDVPATNAHIAHAYLKWRAPVALPPEVGVFSNVDGLEGADRAYASNFFWHAETMSSAATNYRVMSEYIGGSNAYESAVELHPIDCASPVTNVYGMRATYNSGTDSDNVYWTFDWDFSHSN